MGLLAAQPGAFDLFWLPLAATAIGTMILTTRNPRQAKLTAGAIVLIGLGFIALSPLTLPDSPSSAFGQLLLLLVGPLSLVLLALWIKLEDRGDVFGKRFIMSMQMMASLWLVMLWVSQPEFGGTGNYFWELWWSTTLLISALFLFIAANFEQRNASLLYIALGVALIFGFSLIEISAQQAEGFRDSTVEAVAILFGSLLGIGSAIVCWFVIVQRLHPDESEFPLAEQLSDDERRELKAKLAADLDWIAGKGGEVDE